MNVPQYVLVEPFVRVIATAFCPLGQFGSIHAVVKTLNPALELYPDWIAHSWTAPVTDDPPSVGAVVELIVTPLVSFSAVTTTKTVLPAVTLLAKLAVKALVASVLWTTLMVTADQSRPAVWRKVASGSPLRRAREATSPPQGMRERGHLPARTSPGDAKAARSSSSRPPSPPRQ